MIIKKRKDLINFLALILFLLTAFLKYFVPSIVTKILPVTAILLAVVARDKKRLTMSRGMLLFVIFGVFFVFSCFYSSAMQTGFSDSFSYLFAVAFIILMHDKRLDWNKTVFFMTVCCCVINVGTMLQDLNPSLIYGITSRFPYTTEQRFLVTQWAKNRWFSGLFSDRAPAAFFASMLCASGMFYLLRNQRLKNIWKKYFGVLLYSFGIYGIFLTAKRGLLVATVLATLAAYLINRKANGKSILKIVISLSVISVIAYVIISNLEVARVTVSRFIIDENFDNGRIVRYSAILDSLRSNFLFGAGTGSVNEIIGGGGHNIYLTVLLENGVIGALFFIAVLIMQIKTTISVAFRLSKLPDSSNYIALVSFSLFLQVFFITYGMSGNPLYDNYILYYYMIGVLINENFHYRLRQTALGNSNLSLSV